MAFIPRAFLDGVTKKTAATMVDFLTLAYNNAQISTKPHCKEAQIIQKVINMQIEKMKRNQSEVIHYTKALMLLQQILIPLIDNDNFYQTNAREFMFDLVREVNSTVW